MTRTMTKYKDIDDALTQHFVTDVPKLAEKMKSKNDPLNQISALITKRKFQFIDNIYVSNVLSKLKNGIAT